MYVEIPSLGNKRPRRRLDMFQSRGGPMSSRIAAIAAQPRG